MRLCRRNEFWLRLICAYLIFIAGCANSTETVSPQKTANNQPETQQQQDNNAQNDSKKNLVLESAKKDITNLRSTFLENSKDTFLSTNNIIALSFAGSASIVMNQDADNEIAEHFERHRSFRNFKDESLYIIGLPETHFAIAGIWYALSAENQDDFNNRRAWTMMNALFLTWTTTGALKCARNNETPNGKSFAWPSGHTSSSFTFASVLDEFYGPKVGIPAYVIASLVGYRMMDTGDHWASDVVFGATLGWIVGHSIAGKHKKLEIAGFEILPTMASGSNSTIGVSLLKQF